MSKYITRNKVLTEAVENMIREMYKRAQPAGDYDRYVEQYKNGELSENDHVYDWHYLPMDVQSKIVDDYLEAYGANDQFKRWCEFLLQNFKEGGHRTVYKDIFNEGKAVRTGEETEKLPELIGEENAEKVYKLIEDYLGFYRTNMDEHTIRQAIFYCPTSNPDTVIEKWGPDFKIDDSVYKDYNNEDWDYTYKDYYDGVCQGEYFIEDMEEHGVCCCDDCDCDNNNEKPVQ